MFKRELTNLFGSEDDNPITLLVERMRIPIIAGIGTGIAIQASKGVFDTPALFGRIVCTTLPMCGIGFYYLAGTYITGRIRNKDDAFNHVIGAYCTFPVLRRFIPLTYTVAILYFISLPLYAVIHGFKISKRKLTLAQSMNYGYQMTSYDLNVWLKNKSSEPYVRRESYNIFTVPSK